VTVATVADQTYQRSPFWGLEDLQTEDAYVVPRVDDHSNLTSFELKVLQVHEEVQRYFLCF
jgi:hypothetical protein